MQRLMVMLLTLVITIAMAEPHTELAESDSPCLHKPCEHGVCVESAASVQVIKIIIILVFREVSTDERKY